MKTDLLFPCPVPGADYDQEREILTPLKFRERLKWDCSLLQSQMFREGLSSSSAALGKESSSTGGSFGSGTLRCFRPAVADGAAFGVSMFVRR